MPPAVSTLELRKKGISATDTSATYSYLLRSSEDSAIDDETKARAVVLSKLPEPTGFPLAGISLQLIVDKPIVWIADVSYGYPGGTPVPSVSGDLDFGFDIGTENLHIVRGNSETKHSSIVEGVPVAPDQDNFINVQDDGTVSGFDVQVPRSQFSINYSFIGVIPDAYQLKLEGLVTKINSTPFRGRAAGTVMFLGATGTTKFAGSTTGSSQVQLRYAVKVWSEEHIKGFGLKELDPWKIIWQRVKNIEVGEGDAKIIKPQAIGLYETGFFTRADLNQTLSLT